VDTTLIVENYTSHGSYYYLSKVVINFLKPAKYIISDLPNVIN
jgi:hypothetical protein